MTDINPTYKKPFPTQTRSLDAALKLEIMKAINCARAGVIQAFDPGEAGIRGATVSVQIAQQQVTSVSPTGVQTLSPYTLLKAVPVLFTGGGGYFATFPIKVGDECLLIFHDRHIDDWFVNGPELPPGMGRLHDIADAFAIVGLRSSPNEIGSISTTAAQLRSADYTGPTGTGECVEVGPGKVQLIADEVVIHGRNKATFDSGGTGFVYTPSLISTYTDGVTVNHSTPTPPEVPT